MSLPGLRCHYVPHWRDYCWCGPLLKQNYRNRTYVWHHRRRVRPLPANRLLLQPPQRISVKHIRRLTLLKLLRVGQKWNWAFLFPCAVLPLLNKTSHQNCDGWKWKFQNRTLYNNIKSSDSHCHLKSDPYSNGWLKWSCWQNSSGYKYRLHPLSDQI